MASLGPMPSLGSAPRDDQPRIGRQAEFAKEPCAVVFGCRRRGQWRDQRELLGGDTQSPIALAIGAGGGDDTVGAADPVRREPAAEAAFGTRRCRDDQPRTLFSRARARRK